MKTIFAIITILITAALLTSCSSSDNKIYPEDKMTGQEHKYTNNLIKESSPYLLQHAHNPVDWYAWGDEAFEKASSENKPIFLSIGYSTCHWCHVMEHESFEDEEVAALMNRAYISIKVDREERPDLDAVFMETAMMMNRRGGWPLNLILTPEGKPFYSATYIPKNGNSYTPGMMELLPQIETIWENEPEKLIATSQQVIKALESNNSEASFQTIAIHTGSDFEDIKKAAVDDLKKRYDSDYGGFNRQPKFPQPQNILLLLRQYAETGNTDALQMAEKTLTNMRSGGIYDHIGFGFHRYSTDQKWLLPHFEKMLYDQAMLIIAYTEAYQLTRDDAYRQTADEIITYILRDMRSPEGGFYSAEDADSEGKEGKFYVWDYKEFFDLIDKNDLAAQNFAEYFNIQPQGNFADEATKIKTGENIPHLTPASNPTQTKQNSNRPPAAVIEKVRSLLFSEREKRIHPYKDDKILTDWNGLMIFALAKAAWVFDSQDYLKAAESAAAFIMGEMKQPDGSLNHSFRLGKSGTAGMIDDYAFLSRGLLELYRAGFNSDYIKQASELISYARQNFEDTEHGGFFQSDIKQNDLLIRKKVLFDNALPSGNSVMFENLMQMFKLTGKTFYRESADGILKTTADELNQYPSAFAMLLSSLGYAGSSGREIIIVGTPESTAEMLDEINRQFRPGTVVLHITSDNAEALKEIASYTQYYSLPEGKTAAAYVCTDFTCSRPVFDVEELREVMRK